MIASLAFDDSSLFEVGVSGCWCVAGGDIVTGEIEEEQGEPFMAGFALLGPTDDVGVVDDRR